MFSIACRLSIGGGGGGASPPLPAATLGAFTVTTVDELRPSLVAEMVAVPGPTARIVPSGATVATPGLLELHDTERPVSTAPLALRRLAEICTDPPTTRGSLTAPTMTVPTPSGSTVTLVLAECPSLVAVSTLVPGAIAV